MSIEKHLRDQDKAFDIIVEENGPRVDFKVQPTYDGGKEFTASASISGDGNTEAIKATGKKAIIFDTRNITGEDKILTFPNISGEIMVKGVGEPLSVSNGGTGRTSLTANALLYGNGTGSVNLLNTPKNTTDFLRSSSSGAPTWGKITWNDIVNKSGETTLTISNITNAIGLRHTQNTDAGTTSTSFYLGGVNPTYPLYLRNNAGTLEVTNNAATPALRNFKAANITANNVSAPAGTITAPNIPNKASSTFWGEARYSNGIMTVTINDSWATPTNLDDGFSLGFISPSDTTLAATQITLINSALPDGSQTLFTAEDIYIDSSNKIKANSLKGAVQLRYNGTNFFLANGGGGDLVLGDNCKIKESSSQNLIFYKTISENETLGQYDDATGVYFFSKKKYNEENEESNYILVGWPKTYNRQRKIIKINSNGDIMNTWEYRHYFDEPDTPSQLKIIDDNTICYITSQYQTTSYGTISYFKGNVVFYVDISGSSNAVVTRKEIGGQNKDYKETQYYYSSVHDFCATANKDFFVLFTDKNDKKKKIEYYQQSGTGSVLKYTYDLIPGSHNKMEVLEYNNIVYVLVLIDNQLFILSLENSQLVLKKRINLIANHYGTRIEILDNGDFLLSGYQYNINNLLGSSPSLTPQLHPRYKEGPVGFVRNSSLTEYKDKKISWNGNVGFTTWDKNIGLQFEIKDSDDNIVNNIYISVAIGTLDIDIYCKLLRNSDNATILLVANKWLTTGKINNRIYIYKDSLNFKLEEI